MTYANAEERSDLISGLRELADFLEQNPEVPAPPGGPERTGSPRCGSSAASGRNSERALSPAPDRARQAQSP
jgi:hypothetical protein